MGASVRSGLLIDQNWPVCRVASSTIKSSVLGSLARMVCDDHFWRGQVQSMLVQTQSLFSLTLASPCENKFRRSDAASSVLVLLIL